MVNTWAEKERRNYERLRTVGIPTPAVVALKQHVLVMEFVGKDGVAAPRLKDAGLPTPALRESYTELLVLMRRLYQDARLVHADLSEYNLLVHDGKLVMIDVS